MWIKIKNTRINLTHVSDYTLRENDITFYYPVFTGEDNDDQHFEIIACDTRVEAKAIIKELDEALGVKEL